MKTGLSGWLGRQVGSAISGFKAGVKKSFAASVLAWTRGDDLTETPAARLSKPYAQSAWVFAAVNRIADELSGRPLKFYLGKQPYEDSALAEWWAAPALGPKTIDGQVKRLPIADVNRDLAAWASLEGEYFIAVDDSWLLLGARSNLAALPPFAILRPDRTRLIVESGTLTGYEYTDSAGRRSTFVPQQVFSLEGFQSLRRLARARRHVSRARRGRGRVSYRQLYPRADAE